MVSACAHGGESGVQDEQYLLIESPFFPAEISINGETLGSTPLKIPYARIRQRVLRVSAVAIENAAYRQELSFDIPPVPEKIVVLAFNSKDNAGSLEDLQRPAEPRKSAAEKECVAQPILTPTVFFDTDKSDLSPRDLDALKVFGESMLTNSYPIEIIGFADERHTVPYNLHLSLRRAQAVFQALLSCNVPANRMQVEGRGEIQTLDADGRKMAWQHNRRVEIRIVQ